LGSEQKMGARGNTSHYERLGIVASILGWTHKPTAKLVEVRDN
jgi:hypothetical protein